MTLEETPDEQWGYGFTSGHFILNITDQSLMGPRARHLAPRHYDPANIGSLCVDPTIGKVPRFSSKKPLGIGVSFSYQEGMWHVTERARLEEDGRARVYRKSSFRVLSDRNEFDDKTKCGAERLVKVFDKLFTVPGLPDETIDLAKKLYDSLVRKDYVEVKHCC